MFMSSTTLMTEHAVPIEINASGELCAMIFSANGEHLFSGGRYQHVGVWQVQDGQRVGTIEAWDVLCLAASKDGKQIAGGTSGGWVFVWDAKTHNKAWSHKGDPANIFAVDFSPDSKRLVSGSFDTATIWDVETGKHVQSLCHGDWVTTAKYSPDGNRIATTTWKDYVHVWDSNDGCLLLDIPVKVTPLYNKGLSWFDNRIFAISDNTIKRLDAVTGSIVSECPAPNSDQHSCIALAKHGRFLTYTSSRTVTFWDIMTHSQLGLIDNPEGIHAIALPPDEGFLAIGGVNGKIIVGRLPRRTDLFPLSRLHPTLQDTDIQINHAALNAWKYDHLNDAETLLTTAIHESQNSKHYLLAARALVRARLGCCDEALLDANAAIEIQPSIIAYIANSLAHIGKAEKDKAYRACDIAFEHFHSSHVTLLLLIKAVIVFMAGEHADAISRMDDLIATVPSESTCCMAYMCLLKGNADLNRGNYEGAIHFLERARAQVLRPQWGQPPLVLSLMSGWKLNALHITVRQHLCEAMYAAGRKDDAGQVLLEMVNSFDEEIYTSKAFTEWICQFTHQCLSAPESTDDSNTARNNYTAVPHATAPSLLREWVKAKLILGSWRDALCSAICFVVSRFTVFHVICENLETIGYSMEAVYCFRQMVYELVDQDNVPDEQAKWVFEFRQRCVEKLEHLGNASTSSAQHDDAVSFYSFALSLNPAKRQGLLLKRSKAHLAQGLWEEALRDANEVIKLNPLSPWGYESRHAVLHKAGSYQDAIDALEAMLSRIAQSSDPEICALHCNYVSPSETKATIRRAIQDAIRDSPRVLINTSSGRLCDKLQQAASFESLPVFNKLVSSMKTHIDDVAIEHEVMEHYRYGMFSHKWEDNEPLFEQVLHIAVHDLEESPTHDKLKMFCKIIQGAGLHWAWSDTCCINKADHFVRQEALVSMFKWYQGSDLTAVFLFDVISPSRRGDLMRSMWNSRAWTFQEYHASKVVKFYTKDWKLYMNLDVPNHKESLEIISEMEEATGISARALAALRPGLDDIREKLSLASTRETTLVEDAAYSLLGTFSMSLPVVYGEGDHALGRLLAQLLTSSGDASILSWTGKPGSFNSCLPNDITVFKPLPPLHLPRAIATSEMEKIVPMLRASSPNLALLMNVYDRLHELPVPSFSGQRMKLPCIVFKLGAVATVRDAEEQTFRAQTDALGVVEIQTEQDLSQFHPLYLVHPWIDFLLDRQPVGSVIQTIPEENAEDQSSSMGTELPSFAGPSNTPGAAPKKRTSASAFASRFTLQFGGRTTKRSKEAGSLLPPSTVSQEDRMMRALQVAARLQQPFGALLLTLNPGKVAAYKRVAAETLITVKVEDTTTAVLNKLIFSVRVLDVL